MYNTSPYIGDLGSYNYFDSNIENSNYQLNVESLNLGDGNYNDNVVEDESSSLSASSIDDGFGVEGKIVMESGLIALPDHLTIKVCRSL